MAGWTDENQHDPGVTVLELAAWLACALLLALAVSEYLKRRRRRRRAHREPHVGLGQLG